MSKVHAVDISTYYQYLLGSLFPLTNMKINKLLYFVQGHALARLGRPMFEEPIEVWPHGPAIQSVYDTYKQYGAENVPAIDAEPNINTTAEEYSVLWDVARTYGAMTASQLRAITHQDGSPWAITKSNNQKVIPVSLMREWFAKNGGDISFQEPEITEDMFIGYRDSEGSLVLPKEWNDEAV